MDEIYDCQRCGACCREAFDTVEVDEDDPFVRLHPELLERTPFDKLGVIRKGPNCAALDGGEGCWSCRIYDARPWTCRDVEPGAQACLWARERLGISASGG